MRFLIATMFVVSGTLSSAAQSIEVKVVSATDEQAMFGDKKEQCELGFEITNNAWGTLNRIAVPLGATDDRGRGVDKLLIARASNSDVFTWIPIAKGQTAKVKGDAVFKEECKYIAKIYVDGSVDDEDCAIRMMPEEAKCSDIVKLTTSLPNLKTE
ncbi:hypothetical protein MesoLj113b_34460 [Mesorhizobium sp. 113-3-3]|nr:hypothetical protein MesoLj113b_34460 [Mesorhizobium sp. 113-3-3]